jgi:hypothetical protein
MLVISLEIPVFTRILVKNKTFRQMAFVKERAFDKRIAGLKKEILAEL